MAKDKVETPKNRPSKDQIAEWKKQYGGGHFLWAPSEGAENAQLLVLRKPGLHDIEKAQLIARKKDKPNEFARNIIANCKLYEDEGMLSNDENMLAVIMQVDEIVKIKEIEVKEF